VLPGRVPRARARRRLPAGPPRRAGRRAGGGALMTTVAPDAPAGAEGDNTVGVTIDGVELRGPKGTPVIRAAGRIRLQDPRFCDHPLLDPVGACRQCIVEVQGQRKPVAACTVAVSDGMVVHTQLSSPAAAKAQAGTMELLLINHPLDCP